MDDKVEKSIKVIIPTYNAGKGFCSVLKALLNQKGICKDDIFIIDSSSSDGTDKLVEDMKIPLLKIRKEDFRHGGTRQKALELCKAEYVVFMTQDATLTRENSILTLVKYLLTDEKLAAVYGRQLPYPNTGPLGTFARLHNYSDKSFVNSFEDKKSKGIKTVFLSDTFAAYKKSLLQEIGGFPLQNNFGEDSYVAAKLIMAGYKTGYCAEASVYHSHDFNLKQEYERYKCIKRFHKEEPWLLETFGRPGGEGLKFVYNEAKYLISDNMFFMMPIALLHNVAKWLGYRFG